MRLSEHGFNFYPMLVVDLLHEFELGVWKAVLTHLLRILHANGNNSIQSFNKRSVVVFNITRILKLYHRFRQVPTFGRGTIRRFGNNVSAMKKLAGRDFEDILQVT
jgi:hypothetical protein